MAKKQHKVGERFVKCGIIYEVREQVEGLCAGCDLLIDNEELVRCTDAIRNDFEPCDETLRDDEKNIIFVKVGEAPDGAPLNSDTLTPHEADSSIRDITASQFDEMLGEEPQKSAGWTKRDETKLSLCRVFLNAYKNYQTLVGRHNINSCIDWLNEIKVRMQGQPIEDKNELNNQ